MKNSHQTTLNTLIVALHPDLKRPQRLNLSLNPSTQTNLPQPTSAILTWLDTTLEWLEQGNGKRYLLYPTHPGYPKTLLDLKDPPLLLFCQGNLNLLHQPGVGMVGSRNASSGGLQTAYNFSKELAQNGWCINSGLAEGIDGASHSGALAVPGHTVAVLGGAIDKLYPKHHTQLAQSILDNQGLLLSEYPPGTAPRPAFFPQRNRIIAGLSEGVLVVEAAKRSGSLITARQASELGRLVMALPGSIHSTHSKGCHEMIKKGALLVETVQEIEHELLSTLTPEKQQRLNALESKACPTEPSIPKPELPAHVPSHFFEHLNEVPTHIDELAQNARLAPEEVLAHLTELELEGWVICESGNRWVRAKVA